ncbi:MAG: Septum formation protein Maf [Segetibacter sp.]|nr:Septum formation protein Maf [Segetibacter sp.]
MNNIILASQSPRRRQLLEWAEISFQVVIKSIEETWPAELPIEEVPVYIARQKAAEVNKHLDKAFHSEFSNNTILAADTVVVLAGTIINKPENRADAISILKSLSGKSHRVITGVVILTDTSENCFSEITEVEFHELNDDQIEFYVDKYKPYDKAGAYAIQEWIGVIGIKSIKGDFYNVMGLPISRVVQELQKMQD